MNEWMIKIRTWAEPELQALSADMRARFLHASELLETFGSQKVGMPHIRSLDGKLWEMRMQGKDGIARAVYAAIETARKRLEAVT
jgi:hypothetical protein